jgi:hypothetical protein
MIGKAELIEAVAGKNRGLLATERDKQAILVAIANLEDRNPTPARLRLVIYLTAIGGYFIPPVKPY